MRIGKKTWLVLLLLLLLGGLAYPVGRSCWGSYHFRAAQRALDERDFRQADIHLKHCLAIWPDDPSCLLLAAQTARRRGHFDKAHRYLDVYERKGGSEVSLALERRLLRFHQGDHAEESLLLAFCAAFPQAPETSLILETLLMSRLPADGPAPPLSAKYPPLADQWLKLRQSRADQVQGQVWRGRLLALTGDHDKALADLRQALQLDPDHFEARLHLALEIAQQAPEESVAHLEMLRHAAPTSLPVSYGLATAYRSLGRLAEARQLLDEILAVQPDDPAFLVERGQVDVDAQQPEAAQPWLRRALEVAPHSPETNLAFSRYLRLAGQPEEANHYHAQFLKLDAERSRKGDKPAVHGTSPPRD